MVTPVLSTNIAAVSVSADIVEQAFCLTIVPPLSDSAWVDQLRDKVVNLGVGGTAAGLDLWTPGQPFMSGSGGGGGGDDISHGYQRGGLINIADQGIAKYPPLQIIC